MRRLWADVEAGVQSQTFGDGENHLPVRDGRADLFGHVSKARVWWQEGHVQRCL